MTVAAMIAVIEFALQFKAHAVQATIEIGAFREVQAATAITRFEEIDPSHLLTERADFHEGQAASALTKRNTLLKLSLTRINVVVGEEWRGVGRAGQAHGRGNGGKGGDCKSLFHSLILKTRNVLSVSMREDVSPPLRSS